MEGLKGIHADELLLVASRPVVRTPLPETEEGSQLVLFFFVQIPQHLRPRPILLQQAAADYLIDVLATEIELAAEAALDFGEVLALAILQSSEHGVHVLLAGDEDPAATLALGVQIFGDGLQVGHQLSVVADELADLIHEEVEAESGGLTVQVVGHPLGEGLDAEGVAVAVAFQQLFGPFHAHTAYRRVGLTDRLFDEVQLIAALLPGLPLQFGVFFLKGLVDTAAVHIALQLGQVPEFRIIALHLVEYVVEYGEYGIRPGFVQRIGLRVDVE